MPKSKEVFGADKPSEETHETYQLNEAGEMVDKLGNVYDEMGQLIREAPSEELQKALALVRLRHPDVGSDDEEVQLLVEHFKRQKKAGKRK